MIKNNLTIAEIKKVEMSENAQVLQEQIVNIDSQSTITAVMNSKVIYDISQVQKSSYRSVLEEDASHIGTISEAFEELDQDISAMLSSGLLGE